MKNTSDLIESIVFSMCRKCEHVYVKNSGVLEMEPQVTKSADGPDQFLTFARIDLVGRINS